MSERELVGLVTKGCCIPVFTVVVVEEYRVFNEL